ncbi:MAG: hypothetical protein F6J92_01810 [Symploca sp. SIO1A3]|nr:hypothetical protein [Symploca sp. SIO1A3]
MSYIKGRRQKAGGRRQEGRKKVAREKGIISDYPKAGGRRQEAGGKKESCKGEGNYK